MTITNLFLIFSCLFSNNQFTNANNLDRDNLYALKEHLLHNYRGDTIPKKDFLLTSLEQF